MKQIYTLLALCALATSCNLDIIPQNTLTYTNAFISERDLNTTTTTIHFYLSQLPDLNIFYDVSTPSEELLYGQDVRDWSPFAVVSRQPSWSNHYNVIFESNLLLDNIYRTENLSEERRNYHRGQALFAKGFAYFSLSRAFGKAVITKDSKQLTAYPISDYLDVIDAAIESAKEGLEILPVHAQLKTIDGAPVPNKQFASKGSCAALLAHAYAWKGSIIDLLKLDGNAQEAYEMSVKYASMIMDGSVGAYSLAASPEELCEMMSNPTVNNPEDIFLFAFDLFRSEYSVSPSPYGQYVGWPVNRFRTMAETSQNNFRLYKSTVEHLFPDPNDQRKEAYFYKYTEPHPVDGVDYAIAYKYRNAINVQDQTESSGGYFRTINANYNYWRLADIILLQAECLAKLGHNDEAIADLNRIRARAGAQAYPASYDAGQDLREAIFHERERELLGESDSRYFDIVRNNYVKKELGGKFPLLTATEIKNGALFLPIPPKAYQDKDGQIVNTRIVQSQYWSVYM